MELPSLGTHCAEATCNQLDFLPYICPFCPVFPDTPPAQTGHSNTQRRDRDLAAVTVLRGEKRYLVYCAEHRNGHTDCPGRQNTVIPAVNCPLCNVLVPTGQANSDPSAPEVAAAVERHVKAGCRTNIAKCAISKCKNKSLLKCNSCSKGHCTAHRFPEAHGCARQAQRSMHSPAEAAALARKTIAVR